MKRKNKSHDDVEGDAADETPASSEPEQDGADESLESLRAQRDEYLELCKRAQADYKNLRRRAQADLEAGVRRAMTPLLENLLLVLDHLDIALASPTTNEETRNFALGVKMTRDQFRSALEQEELIEVDTSGKFDPDLHQAVAAVEDADAEAGTILDTVRKGYTWRGTVLRHAHVRVAAGDASGSRDDSGASADDGVESGSEGEVEAAERE